MIKESGSLRVDLLGGTLDLEPLNYLFQDVVTLNLALQSCAVCSIERQEDAALSIESLDYQKEYHFSLDQLNANSFYQDGFFSDHVFKEMLFVVSLCDYFKPKQGLKIQLSSGSPPGAGLGGSSTMGLTLFNALARFFKSSFSVEQKIRIVKNIEAKILNSGISGYQDYYPACYGGVLALHPKLAGVEVEQLYSDQLAKELEGNLILAYSGQTRLSGLNNWNLYQKFFSADAPLKKALAQLAILSHQAYQSLLRSDYADFFKLLCREGELRRDFFPGFETAAMSRLRNLPTVRGVKVCGAGGGGCFLIITNDQNTEVFDEINRLGMQRLNFQVARPVEEN